MKIRISELLLIFLLVSIVAAFLMFNLITREAIDIPCCAQPNNPSTPFHISVVDAYATRLGNGTYLQINIKWNRYHTFNLTKTDIVLLFEGSVQIFRYGGIASFELEPPEDTYIAQVTPPLDENGIIERGQYAAVYFKLPSTIMNDNPFTISFDCKEGEPSNITVTLPIYNQDHDQRIWIYP